MGYHWLLKVTLNCQRFRYQKANRYLAETPHLTTLAEPLFTLTTVQVTTELAPKFGTEIE